MEILRNEVERGNWLEIKADPEKGSADVAIFAQEWLEKNYDDNEYCAEVKDAVYIEEEDMWICKYYTHERS